MIFIWNKVFFSIIFHLTCPLFSSKISMYQFHDRLSPPPRPQGANRDKQIKRWDRNTSLVPRSACWPSAGKLLWSLSMSQINPVSTLCLTDSPPPNPGECLTPSSRYTAREKLYIGPLFSSAWDEEYRDRKAWSFGHMSSATESRHFDARWQICLSLLN